MLGLDDEGREILTYIEGFVPYAPDIPAEIWADEALATAAVLVRRYHDAVASFEPPVDAEWRFGAGAPTGGEIVCHNDLAPWNLVYRENVPTAFIDWDFAAPAPRLWDVAYAAWRFVPLYWDGIPATNREADVAEYARRLRLFCDEYGLQDRSELLDVISRRQRAMYETVRTWGEAGIPGFREMWLSGHADLPPRDNAFLETHRAALAAAL